MVSTWQKWDVDGVDQDQVHTRFERGNQWDWCDVADQGRDLAEEITGKVAPDPFDQIIKGVAAQANFGAFSALAAMLGLSPRVLQLVTEKWFDREAMPASIGFDEFLALYKQELAEHLDREAGIKRVKNGSKNVVGNAGSLALSNVRDDGPGRCDPGTGA